MSVRKGWAEMELVRMDNERLKVENERSRLKLGDL